MYGYLPNVGAVPVPIPQPPSPTGDTRPVGRCLGCWHDFNQGPCGGCGAVAGPHDVAKLPHLSDRCGECDHTRSEHRLANGDATGSHCLVCQGCAEFEEVL